ncbi:formate dehydrogenase accessory sulfurtransferase FdhD [Methylosinus sporium]|uniref:Sulfur carrier protein FdhD n=1 Tax=Methylosinus sporium TaxID=428 RepID=A0A549SL82_METSR|nr:MULTISPECIES: formate dehydrogenase accessory sulfurtransferase FdhD [Methylosinus]MBU3887168.1 formate dehydrogenase accessory sulfurtransferase FdhD [Methylosinus sp. KRF6]TRL30389.1 formate dehydrogenase accessory sulfurtransferase FdhD [Methylosinus sporium]
MNEDLPAASIRVPCIVRRNDALSDSSRIIPEETPIAFTYGGSTHAVMMATPADLEDFSIGFALTEGLIDSIDEAGNFEIVASEAGIELRSWLAGGRQEVYAARKRSMAGPTGCGLCGIESLEQASRPLPVLANALRVSSTALVAAMDRLPGAQMLNRETRAVHAAAFWAPESDALIVREDVGRHNALDKLAGALARQRLPAAQGVVLMTSRISVELVQKAARIGAPIIAAVSAPTALAVRTAEKCGMTLVAVVRGRDFEIFTHPERILEQVSTHVA